MKSLYNYIKESFDSVTLDLNDENVTEKILQFAKEYGVKVTVDEQKKIIKSTNIFITTQNNTTVIWLNDRNSILGPHIYLIPNKEWKFVVQEIIISPERPIDPSLINLDGSPKLKRVNLMHDVNSNDLDCLKGCSIDTFCIEVGQVKPGFENAIRSLNIKRLEYIYSIAYSGLFFDPNASLNCNELAIRGCKYMDRSSSWSRSKKGDQVRQYNCPCIGELTSLLKNNPSIKVIINWQSDGVYAQARLEDSKLVFDQLDTYNQNMAFKKCK